MVRRKSPVQHDPVFGIRVPRELVTRLKLYAVQRNTSMTALVQEIFQAAIPPEITLLVLPLRQGQPGQSPDKPKRAHR